MSCRKVGNETFTNFLLSIVYCLLSSVGIDFLTIIVYSLIFYSTGTEQQKVFIYLVAQTSANLATTALNNLPWKCYAGL